MTSTGRLYLPFPPPDLGDETPCEGCGGIGITGARYLMRTSETRSVLLDTFCPDCGGCGRANHDKCGVGSPCADGEEDGDTEASGCFSCADRGWWPVQGFTETEVRTLRVPCGCVPMDRFQTVD